MSCKTSEREWFGNRKEFTDSLLLARRYQLSGTEEGSRLGSVDRFQTQGIPQQSQCVGKVVVTTEGVTQAQMLPVQALQAE